MVLLRATFVSSPTLVLLAIAGALSSVAQAGETWDGGGSDNEWSTAANWNAVRLTENPPPNDGTADIIMAGTNRLTPRVDVDWDVNSLTFNSTAGAFSISGDPGVSLGIGAGGITNQDAQLQILLLPIGLNASQTWSASQGALAIGNTIAGHFLIPRTLTLAGANNVQISGAVTNAVAINKTGSGTLTFNGLNTNTYTGGTTVSAGTLVLNRTGGADRAIPGNLVIGDGSGSDVVRLDAANQISEAVGNTVTVNSAGLLNLNGFNETLQNLSFNGGTVSGGGTLFVNGAISSDASSSSASITGGTLDLNGASKTITVADGAAAVDLQISSTITNGSLTKDGAGALMLSGTTSNNITTATINGGTLLLNKSGGGNVISTTGILGESPAADGSVIVTGAGSTWSNNGDLFVGDQGTGTLHITAGGHVSNTNGYVANDFGSTGEVSIDGVGSTWTNNGVLYVGRYFSSSGIVNVRNGGQLSTIEGRLGDGFMVGGTGEVNVDGAGSAWTNSGALIAGNNWRGLLNITGGGTVTTGGLAIGHLSQGFGRVSVDGVGSKLNVTGPLRLGVGDFVSGGTAKLNITNGGVVNSTGYTIAGLLIGDNSTIVNVDGPGSAWINNGDIELGYWERDYEGGIVQLNITNGGYVSSVNTYALGAVIVDGTESTWLMTGLLNVYKGLFAISDGGSVVSAAAMIDKVTVTVDGADSIMAASGDLDVGITASTSLQITGGGQVTSIDGYITRKPVGSSVNPSGSVTVDDPGSAWIVTNNLYVGYNNPGTLTVTGGATVEAGNQLIVNPLGVLGGDGNIVGNVQNGGLVSPGTSAGALNIDGNYTQTADGELLIELVPTSYDQLLVTGNATLTGTLQFDLLDSFVPTGGQSFTILTADNVDGTFTTEMLPSVPGLIFDVIYNPNSVVLTVSPAFTADFDDDGDVDSADLTKWQGDFGVNAMSDADNDGDSDGADFLAWQRQLGSVPAIAATAVVPEPGTFLLFIVASVGFRRTASRRRQELING